MTEEKTINDIKREIEETSPNDLQDVQLNSPTCIICTIRGEDKWNDITIGKWLM